MLHGILISIINNEKAFRFSLRGYTSLEIPYNHYLICSNIILIVKNLIFYLNY